MMNSWRTMYKPRPSKRILYYLKPALMLYHCPFNKAVSLKVFMDYSTLCPKLCDGPDSNRCGMDFSIQRCAKEKIRIVILFSALVNA